MREETAIQGDTTTRSGNTGAPDKSRIKPLGWIADQHRRQEERRCYVCGAGDDGGCHGIDGERAECPWY